MSTETSPLQLLNNDSVYNGSSSLQYGFLRIRTIILHCLWTMAWGMMLLVFAMVCYVYSYAWTFTHPTIEPLTSNPMAALQLPYSDIQFLSKDAKSKMNGWYIPSTSKKTVIFSHGYAGNREEIWVPFYKLAQVLHSNDYNVLMFDYGYVNHEQNHLRVMTAGVREAGELKGAVRYAKQLGAKKVYIWGFSMGAGTALQAALDSTDIDGMILDSTFLVQPGLLEHLAPEYSPFSSRAFIHMVNSLLPLTGGSRLSNVPYEQVNSTSYSIPLFMIHGIQDAQAPYTITKRIFEHQTNPMSELWLPPDRGHEMTYRFQSKEYVERTMHYLNTISNNQNTH